MPNTPSFIDNTLLFLERYLHQSVVTNVVFTIDKSVIRIVLKIVNGLHIVAEDKKHILFNKLSDFHKAYYDIPVQTNQLSDADLDKIVEHITDIIIGKGKLQFIDYCNELINNEFAKSPQTYAIESNVSLSVDDRISKLSSLNAMLQSIKQDFFTLDKPTKIPSKITHVKVLLLQSQIFAGIYKFPSSEDVNIIDDFDKNPLLFMSMPMCRLCISLAKSRTGPKSEPFPSILNINLPHPRLFTQTQNATVDMVRFP